MQDIKSHIKIYLILLVMAGLMAGGCSKRHTSETWRPTAQDIKERLRNLKDVAIESTDLVYETTTVRSVVPSPSDTQVTITGKISISKDEAGRLKDQYAWTAIERSSIPAKLNAIIPKGALKSSETFNQTFDQNGLFVSGVIVVLDDAYETMYITTTDIDHLLE